MSQTSSLDSLDNILGQEFLTWLWYQSDVAPGAFGEARFGLGTGKKVTRALIRLEKEELAFQLTLKAEDFSMGSLKTPKLDKGDDDADPDALLLEKFYLMETCVGLLDSLYARFLGLRLSSAWEEEVAAMRQWMTRTE